MKARENPFSADRVLSVRYELSAHETNALIARLGDLGWRAAIVGPHGAGKTTLLEDLEEPLTDAGFTVRSLRLDADQPRFPRGFLARFCAELDARQLVCLDGAEQLSVWRWMIFKWRTRSAGGLLITTHRAGRLPTLFECRTSTALLERIVRRLTSDRGASDGPPWPAAADLMTRHRGNIREALRELYDVAAASALRQAQGEPLHRSS